MVRAMTDRPYHHGDLKRALIAAGMAILEEEGLAALTLRGIAARAGVSHAAPRNHFGSLRGLVTAIAAEGFRMHAAEMRAGLPEGADRHTRMVRATEGYVRFALTHPALFELMFQPNGPDHSDPDLLAAGRDSYAVLRDIATGLDWQSAGRPESQRLAEAMLWSIAHGYAHLILAGQFGKVPAPATPPFPVADILPDIRYSDDPPARAADRMTGLAAPEGDG